MIEELRARIRIERLARAETNFFSAKSKLTFWWTVFAISGSTQMYLHFSRKYFNGRYAHALRAGLSLLAVFSLIIGVMTIVKLRGAKEDLAESQPVVEPVLDEPESGPR